MNTISDVYDALCRLAPLDLQMDFDNSGFLVGHLNRELHRVLLALDITDEVIDEAEARGAELIVSHHPLIFHKLSAVTDAAPDSRVLHLVEKGIGAVCMHTNLDIAEGGVNDVLIHLLGASCEDALDADGCGRIGVLPEEMPLTDFLAHCKTVLQANGLRYYDAGRPVKHLAVMGGAGADSLVDAWKKGCDTYVTADIKYHQFQDAACLGLNLIDADHFSTENPVIPVLADYLSREFPDLEIVVSKRHHAIISFF